MLKTVLKFGFICGGCIAAFMFATLPFAHRIGLGYGMVIGFTSMFLAFLLVFFGIRSYRENVNDGEISFVKAFNVGLLIMLTGVFCYVVAWQIVYFNFLPNFFEEYTTAALNQMKAAGKSTQEIEAQRQELEVVGNRYHNPLWNAAYTSLEPLPIGIPVTLVSAIILRRKRKSLTPTEQAATS